MRKCLIALLFAQFVFAFTLRTHAEAQETQQSIATTAKGEVADIAEQLVAQAQKWFEALSVQGRVPRVFTGITRDARQVIVELDGLPFDQVKRRDFLIWLCQRHGLIAYAYVTRVMKQASGRDEPVEALDIYASSLDKDVFASLSIARQPDGSIRYAPHTHLSDNAKEQRDNIFLGLHRFSHSASFASSEEFEKVWAKLESKVVWRGLNTQLGSSSGDEAGVLITRALQLYASGNCEAAISLSEKAAQLLRKQDKEQSGDFADALVAQALCHKRLVRVTEAERLYRQAIDIYERVAGANSRDLAIALDNLAALYVEQQRLSEAEQLRLRALQILKATLDPTSAHIATALQNLAVLYQYQGRLSAAQEKFLEALPIAEKAYGPYSRLTGVINDNLAGLYRSQRQFEKAEPFYLRAILIFEKTLGRDHPDTALALQNHAILLSETGRSEQAETILKEALDISQRLYGPIHDTIAAALNTLVLHYIQHKRWADALDPARRSAAIKVQLAGRRVHIRSEGGQGASAFRRLVQVAYGLDSSNSELVNESYIASQRALDTNAALALSQLAVRHASGDGVLASLLRERQDLVQELESRDKLLIAAVAKAPDQRDRAGVEHLKSRIGAIGGRIDEIDLLLSKQFPEYASIAKATPISIAETQALLNPNEALLLYLDLQTVGAVPETGFAWLVTKDGAEWAQLPVGTHGLARAVATLRCGLDAKRWLDGSETSCVELLKLDKSARAWLPFDLNVAFELYQTLVRPFEAKIKGKHLLIVPSGALTGLPLSVLVGEMPADAVPSTLDGYRHAAWLGQRQPVTVLPSVSSLKALRQFAKTSRATKAYLGIGNPLLDGAQDDYQWGSYYKDQAQLARDNQLCPKTVPHRVVARAGRPLSGYAKLFRGGNADIEAVRTWSPLPETADELCEVGRHLGVPESEILLGGHATEATLKGLSEQGHLAAYSILHFATHGALTGDVEGSAEPGLILTPPAKGTTDSEALERDDGFLTASEIATLKLDADWVVLSACNTAGGTDGTAEALSGLARAFFYAGARALLVSHWEVSSDAAVKLVTRAFAELGSRPQIGRAEAFRVSMRDMIQKGRLDDAHPSQWAPFVVVGEGSARWSLGETRAPPFALTSPKKPATTSKKVPRPATVPDWRTEVWRQ